MRRTAWVLALACTGCGDAAPEGIDPTEAMQAEPDYVTVDHILIAIQGSKVEHATHDQAAAHRLTHELLDQLAAGADFAKLKESVQAGASEASTNPLPEPPPAE